ncbi:DUF5013 domain-containing protein [Polaribacter aestuariivivens]|uniref:DUF5013 domain-containing protein n=1 Tax=Polaribacter aestuariivivens TaxID=2304626 RepID=A0A5S3N5F6_9FLAO|nr:DUF4998 domain-containing protein [Polaribacter aestuariivivens]TMM30608.1 DUF5013 domain-containing protein [Polaribacter aestuariivivens]
MNNKLKNISFLFLIGLILAGFSACTLDEDDYKKYTEGGEISYAGKLDSVSVFSGKNRIQLNAMLSTDPLVTSYRVYWGNRRDSVVIPVNPDQIATKISQIIPGLEENTYNFEIRSFDDLGNSSIPVFTSGKVYGDRYIATLINRPLVKKDLQVSSNSAVVEFAPVDLTSGIIESELEYTDNNNVTKSFTIAADDTDELILENFDEGNTFRYRTSFKPDSTSIDIFYTDYSVIEAIVPITEAPYFKNAVKPFKVGEFSGVRYGTPEDWIHNEGALNHNGYGVYDSNRGGGIFNLVSGYGEPKLVNAKVYQKMRLKPGTYTYSVITEGNNYDGVRDQVYATVALGGTLPDVKEVETSTNTLGFSRISGPPNTYTIQFTLTDDLTDIAIGLAATNGINPNDPDAEPTNINRYMTFTSFTLKKN